MEILLLLFVLFILFIAIPVLLIVGLVIIFNKKAREKVRSLFGVKKENGRIVSVSNTQTNQAPINTDKDDITQDFVNFMNNQNNVSKNLVLSDFVKTRKGAVEFKVEMVPLFDFEDKYDISTDDRAFIQEKYLQFLIDNDYLERIVETDVDKPFVVSKIVNEMNENINKHFSREAWDTSSVLVQDVFQLFKNDYEGEHSVNGIMVMAKVNKSEIFSIGDFKTLKEIIESAME